jgi:plasmid stabilization system protein ParE
MYKVTWRNPALRELENILDYTKSEWGHEQAIHLMILFKQMSHLLSSSPKIGKAIRRKNTFALVLSKVPFVVFYELCDDEVFVNQVIHMSKRR